MMITVAKNYESRVELGIPHAPRSSHESMKGLLDGAPAEEAVCIAREPPAGGGTGTAPQIDMGNAGDDEMIRYLERLIDRMGDGTGAAPDTARDGLIVDFLERKTGVRVRDDLVRRSVVPSHRGPRCGVFGIEPGIAPNFARTTTALAVLGRVCEDGLFGVRRNRAAAHHLYRHAALRSCPEGTYRLARCLEFGIGAEQDLEKACYFYRLSYKLGSARGLHRFSIMLLKGNYFIERDISLGCHLLAMAAERAGRSYPQPYYDLGMVYRAENREIVADPGYAFRVFLKGAGLGCPNCQYRVSEDYERGANTEKDMEKAFMWCKTAAEQGQSEAQCRVAHILTHIMNSREGRCVGRGMDGHGGGASRPDLERSVSCAKHDNFRIYKQSEDSDFLDIDVLKHYGPKADLRREALAMAERSAAAGNTRGMLLVASILESGDRPGHDMLLCMWYYKIAASMGCKEATYRAASIETKIGGEKTKAPKKGLLLKIMEQVGIL